MTQIICDKCKKIIPSDEGRFVVETYHVEEDGKREKLNTLDLCNDCMKDAVEQAERKGMTGNHDEG